jgi:hypothetical protein
MKCDEETGSGGCGNLMLDRIRYFTGRHMTARDFRDADAYHRTMRHLHNRVLHGWGVACGLEVTVHPRPECGVIIRCGLAIDCCGREIVVRKAVSQRIPWDEWPKTQAGDSRDNDYVLLLCLEYCEVLTEKVPVLYSTEACSSASYEEGRIRESYAFRWHAVKEADLENYGWRTPKGCPPDEHTEPSAKPIPQPCDDDATTCCLDPQCPPHHCVALVVMRGDETDPKVDSEGRRSVAQAQEHLSHVCWISWPHGGFMKVSDFGKLSVRFDRMLAKPHDALPTGPIGINERTFVVQYGQQREDLDFVMYTQVPHMLADRRTAVFEVFQPHEYVGDTIHVTLRCDFIVDCHDNPVDGDHLRGRLPSGNGMAGGIFESWFRVVNDDDYYRLTQPASTPGVKS